MEERRLRARSASKIRKSKKGFEINSEYEYLKKRLISKQKTRAELSIKRSVERTVETNLTTSPSKSTVLSLIPSGDRVRKYVLTSSTNLKRTVSKSSKRSYSVTGSKVTVRPESKVRIEKQSKLSINKLFTLKNKFTKGEKLTKGEIVELRYGKAIPMLPFSETTSKEYKESVMQILRNRPQLILKVIRKEALLDKEIVQYFGLDKVDFTWNQQLENIYRTVCYNKTSSSNTEFKNTYFLVNLGFHKIEKEVFARRHYVTRTTLKDKEIEEVYSVFEKIRKVPVNQLKSAILHVDEVFQKKDIQVNKLLNKARSAFYKDITKKYDESAHNKAKLYKILQFEEKKQNLKSRKVVVLNKLKHKEMTSKLKISLKASKNLQLRNRIATADTADFLNIGNLDRVKNSVLFKKVAKEVYSKASTANYKEAAEEGEIGQRMIYFHAESIQAVFKGYMIRKTYFAMKQAKDCIFKHLSRYLLAKKLAFHVLDSMGTGKGWEQRFVLKILFSQFGKIGLFLSNGDAVKIRNKAKLHKKTKDTEIPKVISVRALALFLEKMICLFEE